MTNEVQLHAPPVLSTPETHIFEDPTPASAIAEARLTNEEVWNVYEVERTAREITDGRWRRIALQFPDHMLGDAVRVFEGLERELKRLDTGEAVAQEPIEESLETSFNQLSTSTPEIGIKAARNTDRRERQRLFILADTSYGACCVDEIAAEHVDAEVVVHYGRSCLSPTARLPVIYVYTSRPLKIDDTVSAFEQIYTEESLRTERKVVLIADIIYHSHVPAVSEALSKRGWKNIIAPDIVHDPSSLIPNRKIEMSEEELKQYSVFHISDPPPALLLTLSSRVKDLYIYPTTSISTKTVQSNTKIALRRRYALLTSLSTCGIFGILINTLSVRNYLETVTAIKNQIAAAGKKSYTFVVGKVNAAKIANFSEIGGWVVIGCWESSLIESTEFYRPIITPFELELCLTSDAERVWSGSWRGDFEALEIEKPAEGKRSFNTNGEIEQDADVDGGDLDSEEESEPPEFDLRTGRYVSHSRPMRSFISSNSTDTSSSAKSSTTIEATSKILAKRAKLDIATVNGAASPGAEYLRNQRTWQGLGSDFAEGDASQSIEEGRSGVARGYTVGDDGVRR